MLHDLFAIGFNGKTSGGLNTFAAHCICYISPYTYFHVLPEVSHCNLVSFSLQYVFNPETGEWRHKDHQVFKDRKWLGHISYQSGKMVFRTPPCPEKGPLPVDGEDCLDKARVIFEKARKVMNCYVINSIKP